MIICLSEEAKVKKINARLKPATKKERASLMAKCFKCERCSCMEYFENTEFGEIIRCPECAAKMYELNEPKDLK